MKNRVFQYLAAIMLINYAHASTFKSELARVLKNNFDINILNLQKQEAHSNYIKSQGEFDLSLTLSTSFNNQDTPISSSLDTQGNTSSVLTKTTSNNLSLSKKLKFGSTININYGQSIVDSNNTYRTFEKTFEPSITISLTQPLIRPFSKGYYSKDINKAWLSYQEKDVDTRNQISETLLKGIEKIFNYAQNKETYLIRKKGYETALKNHEYIMAKKKIGSASLIETLEAQTALNKSQQKMLTQKIEIEKSKMELKTFFNSAEIDIDTIVNNYSLKSENYECPCKRDEMILNALKNRGDFIAKQFKLDSQKDLSRFSNIDRLPKLDLDASYTLNAIKDNLSDAHDDLKESRFKTTKFGATLSYNLFQYAEKGSQESNKLKLKQSLLKLKQLENEIKIEVDLAIDSFLTQKKVINSLKKSNEAEKIKWKFYSKKFKQGQISIFELDKYLTAKQNTQLEYTKALYKLEKNYYKLFKVQGLLFHYFSKANL